MCKGLEPTSLQRGIIVSKHMKKSSTSLFAKQCNQTQTTVRYHFTPRWGSLVGCCLWRCTESDMTKAT